MSPHLREVLHWSLAGEARRDPRPLPDRIHGWRALSGRWACGSSQLVVPAEQACPWSPAPSVRGIPDRLQLWFLQRSVCWAGGGPGPGTWRPTCRKCVPSPPLPPCFSLWDFSLFKEPCALSICSDPQAPVGNLRGSLLFLQTSAHTSQTRSGHGLGRGPGC